MTRHPAGGKCFSHICPEVKGDVEDDEDADKEPRETKHGQKVAEAIDKEMTDLGIDKSKILALGADSTYVNTGAKAGIIAWLEKMWNRRVHHVICLQHINELPTKRLLKTMDGGTVCANKYSGPIGKHLNDVENFELDENFVPLPSEDLPIISEDVVENFNSDQKYLYKIALTITTGKIPENFARYKIADLNHARWTTSSSRLGRFYISKEKKKLDPESLEILKTIVKYIVQVYLPVFFQIRSSKSWLDAPRIYLDLLKRLRKQSPEVRSILSKSIQLGAYCLNEETLLLTMLQDPDEEMRRFAIRKIEDIRSKDGNPNIGNSRFRKKETPKINFDATSLKDVIDWKGKKKMYEPLLTCHLTTEELRLFHSKPYELAPCHMWPCHTQSVERAVREVSISCQQVSTVFRRQGLLLSRLAAREVLPKNNMRADLARMINLKNVYKKPGA